MILSRALPVVVAISSAWWISLALSSLVRVDMKGLI